MQANGVTHDVLLTNMRKSENGIGLFALQDLEPGQVIAEIPHTTCLSLVNSTALNILDVAESLECELHLPMAILYEASLGPASKWWAYLSAIGLEEGEPNVPLLWEDHLLELLNGTGLEAREVRERREMLLDGVAELLEQAGEMAEEQGIEFEPAIIRFLDVLSSEPGRILYADSLATSRGFNVGGEFGEVLLPFGDMLNHACRRAPKEDEDEEADAMMEMSEDEMEIVSLIDEDVGDDVPPMDATMVIRESTVQVMVMSPIQTGAEIMNTYGEYGNAELLQKYGFVVPGNPFDTLYIDHGAAITVMQSTGIVSRRQMRKRLQFLFGHVAEEAGLKELVSESSEWRIDGQLPDGLCLLLFFSMIPEEAFTPYLSMDPETLAEALHFIEETSVLEDTTMLQGLTTIIDGVHEALDVSAISDDGHCDDSVSATALSLASQLRAGELRVAQYVRAILGPV